MNTELNLLAEGQTAAVADQAAAPANTEATTPAAEVATEPTVDPTIAAALATQAAATSDDPELKRARAALKKLVLVTAGTDPDPRKWFGYAADLQRLAEPLGGLLECLDDVKAFAFGWCSIAVNREDIRGVSADKATLMGAIATAFKPVFAEAELLAQSAKKVVDYITLVSMLDPREMEGTLENIEESYTSLGVVAQESVTKKVAERRVRNEAREKIMAFEHPHFEEGMSMAAKVDALEALGYEVEKRDERGNVVMTAPHPTKKGDDGKPLQWHVTVYKDRPANERRDDARPQAPRSDSPRREPQRPILFSATPNPSQMAAGLAALAADSEGAKPSRQGRRGGRDNRDSRRGERNEAQG